MFLDTDMRVRSEIGSPASWAKLADPVLKALADVCRLAQTIRPEIGSPASSLPAGAGPQAPGPAWWTGTCGPWTQACGPELGTLLVSL